MAYQDLRRNGRLYGEYDPERHLLRIKRSGDSEPQIFDLSQYRPPMLPLVVREGGDSEHMGAPSRLCGVPVVIDETMPKDTMLLVSRDERGEPLESILLRMGKLQAEGRALDAINEGRAWLGMSPIVCDKIIHLIDACSNPDCEHRGENLFQPSPNPEYTLPTNRPSQRGARCRWCGWAITNQDVVIDG